jgi:hypothetical protein
LLTTDPHSDVWGVIVSPGLRLNAESETWKVTAGAELSTKRYNEDDLNTTEGALTLRSLYRGERNELGLNAHFIRDNTLVSELATTGVVQAYTPRTDLSVNPTWSHALTPQTKVVVGYAMTVVNYSDTGGTSLTDFREHIATAGVEHNLTERTTVRVAAYYDRFNTENDNFKADTVGVQAGVSHDFSETMRATVIGGPVRTRSETSSQSPVCNAPIVFGVCTGTVITLNSDVTSTTTGYTLTGELDKRWQTATMTVRGGRELNPSGVGAFVRTDSVRLTLSKELSPTVTGLVEAGFYRSKYIGAAFVENSSRYFRIEPSISWRVSPSWVVDAGYSYARQKFEAEPRAATANTVFISISYVWQKYTMSR